MLKNFQLRITLFLVLVFSLVLTKTSTNAATLKGGSSLTTTGFSGLINVASADTINGIAIGLLMSTDFDKFALMPRVGFGFLNVLEVTGGADLPFSDMGYTGGMVGIKWKFWDKDNFKLALSANFQFNGYPDGLNFDTQILFHGTWSINPNFVTSATFGKTLGTSGLNWSDWDFGMGFEGWMVNTEIFQLAAVVDFTNYDQRASMMGVPSAGAQRRGNVSVAARFGFLNKVIMFDIGGTNLLDSDIAFYASIATSFNF